MGFDNPIHLAIAAVIILLVLGPKRLPEAARAAGRGIREFRESITGPRDEIKEAMLGSPDGQEGEQRPSPAQPEATAATASSTGVSPETTSNVTPDARG